MACAMVSQVSSDSVKERSSRTAANSSSRIIDEEHYSRVSMKRDSRMFNLTSILSGTARRFMIGCGRYILEAV